MRPFEPSDVVAAYQRAGLKAVFGGFGASVRDGVVVSVDDQVCALSVMVLGERADSELDSVITVLERRWPDFKCWSFIDGFDDALRVTLPRKDHCDEAYTLGKECRAAVIRAGLVSCD